MILQNCPKCGCLTRANSQDCRKCAEGAAAARRRELAEANRAALEWAMVGETPIDWTLPAKGVDEVEHRVSRMKEGRDD